MMSRALVIAGLFVGLAVVIAHHQGASAAPAASTQLQAATTSANVAVFEPAPETFAKKCSFNSDCSHGKCTKGQCGGCSFNSDCKGWGKCKKGWCGGCSFNSDCKGFGSCSSGKCTKSPY